ncbi:hypothetical protein [Paenibacillus sp. UNC451MF]|uniref:hypothetical protein n=1 Tax=Paenibacillus sp. UNC451MF TaxID=1449063 RepID=UPI000AAA871D|nr:hypothetical protein [Paenibacillus sp. UNC451MF]
MADTKPKGHVEFRQPPAKLVADMAGDEEMREHLEEMMQNDGHPGSCSVVDTSEKDNG